MAIDLAEKALIEERFEPTGDRITDLVLSACAGIPSPDYKGEFAGVRRREHAWCHAKHAGLAYPALVVNDSSGNRVDGATFTHRVFYATDFARSKINHQDAVGCIHEDLKKEWPDDVRIEYGICLIALKQMVPLSILTLANKHKDDDNHTGVVSRLLLKRL